MVKKPIKPIDVDYYSELFQTRKVYGPDGKEISMFTEGAIRGIGEVKENGVASKLHINSISICPITKMNSKKT